MLKATRDALREPARRYQHLTEQIARLDTQLDRLVAQTAPELVTLFGVGTHTAAALLVTAGDNPERLRHEGSFAHLTGTRRWTPPPANSNATGSTAAVTATPTARCTRSQSPHGRGRGHQAVRQERMSEGKTKNEALRCSSATSPAKSTGRSSAPLPYTAALDA